MTHRKVFHPPEGYFSLWRKNTIMGVQGGANWPRVCSWRGGGALGLELVEQKSLRPLMMKKALYLFLPTTIQCSDRTVLQDMVLM